MLAAVLVVTLLAVVGAAYALFRRLLPPLELLGDAMLRVARGNLRYRIRLTRRDEVGRLFAAFNLMAGALQAGQRRPARRRRRPTRRGRRYPAHPHPAAGPEQRKRRAPPPESSA